MRDTLHLQDRPLTRFSRLIAQIMQNHARYRCARLFRFRWYCSPFRRSNSPQNPNFGEFDPYSWQNKKSAVSVNCIGFPLQKLKRCSQLRVCSLQCS